jgi:hypothetical protein
MAWLSVYTVNNVAQDCTGKEGRVTPLDDQLIGVSRQVTVVRFVAACALYATPIAHILMHVEACVCLGPCTMPLCLQA